MDELTITLPECINPNLALPDPALLQIYEDRQNRIIWALESVDEQVYDWVDLIFRCNREDKDIPVEKRKPIRIIIANRGGNLEEAKTLIEVMRLSKTPIYTIAIGICASAASMMFLAGHKRYALSNSTFVLHKGSCNDIGGNFNEVQQFMDQYKKDIAAMINFYKTHTKFSPEIIDKNMETDWYISSQEALDNGLVDSIIEDIDIFL